MPRPVRRPKDVALAAIGALGIVVMACAALIYYAVSATDHITAVREDRLMHRAIDRRLAKTGEDLASATIWDDAYLYTAYDPDPAWMHTNYGIYYHDYMGHDVTLAFDGEDRVIYQSTGGEPALPRTTTAFASAVRPLVARARAMEGDKLRVDPDARGFERVGSAAAVVGVGGKTYLVAASSVVPEDTYARPLAAREPVVVSAIEVDAEFLKDIEAEYGLSAPRLLRTPPNAGAWVPLKGLDGAVLGAITWTPEKPGVGVYRDAQWTILALGLLVTLVLVGVIWRVQRMAAELVAARDLAQAADRAKSEFLANMSHEIRTPLNGVLGMAQVMAAEELSAPQRERLDVIRKSGSTLLSVLNDVLDISKIEAGKLEIAKVAFDAPDLARSVCATFERLAAAKDIALRLDLADGLHPAGSEIPGAFGRFCPIWSPTP